MSTINPYSYWQQSLFQAIELSHPYLLILKDKDELEVFISERAEQAKMYYNELILSAVDDITAKEETRKEILLEDLLFSPTDCIASLFWNKKQKELTEEELVENYKKTQSVFTKYSNRDLYEDTDKVEELEKELSSIFFN